jgi:hypothetical protein
MKIEKLTPEQESKFQEYVDKWIKIGTCTRPSNKTKAEDALIRAYKVASLKPPEKIIWTTSPLAGCIIAGILKKAIGGEPKLDSVGASVWASVRASVWDAVYGQQDAFWLSFYNFLQEVVKLKKETEKLVPLMDLSLEANWVYLYKNIAIMSEKPITCKLNEQRVLHSEDSAAIEYKDGFAVYALNGIRMPDWVIKTPKNDLSVEKIFAIENIEQRAEAIKFIGMNKCLDKLDAKIIHAWNDYELLTIKYEGRRIGPYLKMKNPSTGEIHIEGVGTPNEGVDNTIKTCQQALAWREYEDKYLEPIERT